MISQLVIGLGWVLVGAGMTVVIMELRRREKEQNRVAELTALELASEAASLLEDIEAETPAEARALAAARTACAGLTAVIAIGPEEETVDEVLDLDPLEAR